MPALVGKSERNIIADLGGLRRWWRTKCRVNRVSYTDCTGNMSVVGTGFPQGIPLLVRDVCNTHQEPAEDLRHITRRRLGKGVYQGPPHFTVSLRVGKQGFGDRLGKLLRLCKTPAHTLNLANKSVWVGSQSDRHNRNTTPQSPAHFLVGPTAIVEVRRENRGQRVHRPKPKFDFILPVKAGFDVFVRYEGIYSAEPEASLRRETASLCFDT